MLAEARRYAQTLRHLRPWQVAGRLHARVARRLPGRRPPDPPGTPTGRLRARTPFPEHDPWNTRPDLLAGRFCFLRREADLGRPIDWQASEMPLLWRFNLQYFGYLHLLAPDEQAALCRSWIVNNPYGADIAWHPYPTSLRIVNWCRAGVSEPELLRSLYRQAGYLYRNLETYVYGNHLLENARALVYAGAYFGGEGESNRWLHKGLDIYREETREQILPDGMHYERSPMYHALMLEGYADLLNILPEDQPDRFRIEDTVARMSSVLLSFTHPDGRLALFNDATQEIAPPPERLLAYAHDLTESEPRRIERLPDAGYYLFRNDEIYFVIDGGPVAPDHLMAHAHADIFSYELSVRGLPFVVDTGVYEYAAGEMRDYVRSTPAHNTVSVDGIDQVECWGSFRVARRDRPGDVSCSCTGDVWSFEGTFPGYARWIGDHLVHRRRVDISGGLMEIQDEIHGSGRHVVESRIHLHPDVEAVVDDDGLTLKRGEVHCRVRLESERVRLEDAWYCPEFGHRIRSTAVVIGGRMEMPARMHYAIET